MNSRAVAAGTGRFGIAEVPNRKEVSESKLRNQHTRCPIKDIRRLYSSRATSYVGWTDGEVVAALR